MNREPRQDAHSLPLRGQNHDQPRRIGGIVPEGGALTISISFSQSVTVSGGTPTLILNGNGVAAYDPTQSADQTLVFTTSAGFLQYAKALAITSVSLNGAFVGNAVVHTTASFSNPFPFSGDVLVLPGTVVMDGVQPLIGNVAASPSGGAVITGQTVTLSFPTSEPVSVTGTPTLSLNDGAVATYSPMLSISTKLAFTYTVQAADNTNSLSVTRFNLNGGTVTDLVGVRVTRLPDGASLPMATGQTVGVNTTSIGIATFLGAASLSGAVYRFLDANAARSSTH